VGFFFCGFIGQFDNLGQSCVFGTFGNFYFQISLTVVRPCIDTVTGKFLFWQRLTGDHCLIQKGVAGNDYAVKRDDVSWLDYDNGVYINVIDNSFFTLAFDQRGFRGPVDQVFQRFLALCYAVIFHGLTQGEEDNNDYCLLKLV